MMQEQQNHPLTTIFGLAISLCSCASLVFFVLSCGRMASPVPPERTSPKFVEGFAVTQTNSVSPAAISLSWKVPEHDQRGKKLTDLYGYRIYRKDVSQIDKSCLTEIASPPVAIPDQTLPDQTPIPIPTPTATFSPEQRAEWQKHCEDVVEELKIKNFEKLSTIPDSAIANLQRRKIEAREKGEISRKVSLTEQEKQLSYQDKIQLGKEYAYKIVPFNSFFVELDPDILNFVTVTAAGVVIKQYTNPQYETADEETGYFQSSSDDE